MLNILFLFFFALPMMGADTRVNEAQPLCFLLTESHQLATISASPDIKFEDWFDTIARHMGYNSAEDIFCVSKNGMRLSEIYNDFTVQELRNLKQHKITGMSPEEAILVSPRITQLNGAKFSKNELFEVCNNHREKVIKHENDKEEILFWQSSFVSYKLSNLAENLVIKEYAQKYIKNDESKFFYSSQYQADLLHELYIFITSPTSRVGFFTMQSTSFDPFNHVIPLVIAKRDAQWHLFISDSLGASSAAFNKLYDFCCAHNIVMYLSIIPRQKDSICCHSDAPYYLQRSSRLESFFDAVMILDPKNPSHLKFIENSRFKKIFEALISSLPHRNFMVFIEGPDLLLTSQHGEYLDGIMDRKLMCSKNNKTVRDKLSSYSREMTYNRVYHYAGSTASVVDQSQQRIFTERTFLGYLTKKHYYMLDKYLKKDKE